MSFEFSRRNFLKYSAIAAVAVAGAGLFTGCKGSANAYNYYQDSAGELEVLNVTAALGTYSESDKTYAAPDITGTTVVIPFKITNGRNNPLSITPYNFKVTITDSEGKALKKYSFADGMTMSASLYDVNLAKESSTEGTITVNLGSLLSEGEHLVLTYCPDLEYNEYSANWILTR